MAYKTVADIMTENVLAVTPEDNLQTVHQLMRDKNIRHVPVVERGELKALLTQKIIMREVIKLLSQYGQQELSAQEAQINVMDIADTSPLAIFTDTPLLETASYFLQQRHGCLPVINNDRKLIGIVTSSDFVRLSLNLLKSEGTGDENQ